MSGVGVQSVESVDSTDETRGNHSRDVYARQRAGSHADAGARGAGD